MIMANNKVAQRKQIRTWLEDGNTITPLQALRLFGTMKLSTRIGELIREDKMTIQKQRIRLESGKQIMMYYL